MFDNQSKPCKYTQNSSLKPDSKTKFGSYTNQTQTSLFFYKTSKDKQNQTYRTTTIEKTSKKPRNYMNSQTHHTFCENRKLQQMWKKITPPDSSRQGDFNAGKKMET